MSTPVRRLSAAYSPTAPSSKTLWRVMSLEKLETLVLRRGLWLSRLDQFGTKYEGSLPASNNMGLLSMFPAPDAAWLAREYQRGVLRSYASCWHVRDKEPDPLVWAEFDKSGQGVAVRVDLDELVSQLQLVAPNANTWNGGVGPLHVGAVRYLNHATDQIPDGNVLEAQFVVRDKWSYQTELRILAHTHGTAAYEVLYGKTGPFGDLVRPVFAKDSQTHQTELEGGHASGTALVLPIAPRRLVQEIIPNGRMAFRSRVKLAVLSARAGMPCRVRWR